MKNIVSKGQVWKSKTTGIVLKVKNKASGNRHWTATQVNRKGTHKIHEGTLEKFYELINK